jgi:hypothetical protein
VSIVLPKDRVLRAQAHATAHPTPLTFPAASRHREVREAAEMLNRTHGEAATLYWRTLVRSIAEPMTALGVPEDEVRRQIFAFQDAVQAELRTMADC